MRSFLVLLICVLVPTVTAAWGSDLVWKRGEFNVRYAFGCNFVNGDIANAKVPGEQCGGLCKYYNGCTHFTWTNYEGGTCWLKSIRTKAKIEPADQQTVCGYV